MTYDLHWALRHRTDCECACVDAPSIIDHVATLNKWTYQLRRYADPGR